MSVLYVITITRVQCVVLAFLGGDSSVQNFLIVWESLFSAELHDYQISECRFLGLRFLSYFF